MTRLAREIATHVVFDLGPEELLRRLSDPFWFQALGCVLGFDWHSIGVTTTVTGALKEGLRGIEHELGVYSQGGKGATSRKTPLEIRERCDQLAIDSSPLVYASRLAAKVDSAAVQDGYQLYHHAFFFSRAGHWCVIQQGMSDRLRTARRYHWLSESVTSFVNEPHEAICSDLTAPTLNLVAAEHEPLRSASVELASGSPERVIGLVRRAGAALKSPGLKRPRQKTRPSIAELPFEAPSSRREFRPMDLPTLDMPRRHALELRDVDPHRLESILLTTYERAPQDFETLLGMAGVGARTLRALALVSEVVYGTPASTRDPARFAFAHGGKDGTPFPVDRATYDRTISILRDAVNKSRVDRSERVKAFARLAKLEEAAT